MYQLAIKFITVVLLSLSASTVAQEEKTPCQKSNLEGSASSLSLNTSLNPTASLPLTSNVSWANQLLFCSDIDTGYWAEITSIVGATVGDNTTFNGITASVVGSYVKHATKIETLSSGREITSVDLTRLAHILNFAGGIETDGTLQNVSFLIEAGYTPLVSFDNFTLGTSLSKQLNWVELGGFLQAGYTTSLYQPAPVTSTQNNQETRDSSGALVRFKFGGDSQLYTPLNFLDAQSLRLLSEAWLWYDILNNKMHGRVEGTLSLDFSQKASYNILNVKLGSNPPDFAPGAQFSTGLTIRF